MEPLRPFLSPDQRDRSNSAGGHLVSQHAPTHDQVRRAQRKARAAPNACRLLVRVVALALAASILSVLAHVTVVYFKTRNVVQQHPNGVRQRAWPFHIDNRPTWAMLAAAVISVVVQILSMLTFCGSIRKLRESRLRSWAVFFTSLLGITAWLAAAAYFKWQDSQGKQSWDLWSWSCTHKSLVNGKMSFEAICVEMRYTWYASILVAVFELVGLAIFGHILYRSRKDGPGYSRITVSHI